MDAAVARICGVADFLRGQPAADLILSLTMVWVPAGRDDTEHAMYRATVDRLLSAEPATCAAEST